VWEAARATSAAPTYFPVQCIGQPPNARYFADGGMEFNNPTHEVLRHYSRQIFVAETRRHSTATDISVSECHPGGLDFTEVRFVNIGTGDQLKKSDTTVKSSRFAYFIPPEIRMGLSLARKLKKMAVTSERVTDQMRTLARGEGGRMDIQYMRFSADNGVCLIKMDNYKKMAEIKNLTKEYLEEAVVQRRLRQLAVDIAKDYLAKQSTIARQGGPNHLTVPQHHRGPHEPIDSRIIGGLSPSTSNSVDVSYSNRSSTDVSNPGQCLAIVPKIEDDLPIPEVDQIIANH